MHAPRTIVIVGAGVVGTTAALAFARALPLEHHRIICIPAKGDDADLGAAYPVVASSPAVRAFHAELGVDEGALVRSGTAGFSLGTAYVGWLADAVRPSFQPHGDIGVPVGGVPFHQLLARLAAAGHRLRSTDYSIAALMAQAGRFVHPVDDPQSPLSSFTYGLHLHRQTYAAHLKMLAEKAGATFLCSRFENAQQSQDGLAAVQAAHGSVVQGDLFIDASGPKAPLLKALGTTSHARPGTDRLIAWDRQDPAPAAPYDVIATHPAGWQLTTPGPQSVSEVLAFSSNHLSDDQAIRYAVSSGAPADAMVTALPTGRHDQFWHGNVIALGGAGSALPPLGVAPLHLAQEQIRKLLRLLPAGPAMSVERAEFNREASDAADRMQDYLQLRFALNGQREPFWGQARQWPRSAALDHKISSYRHRGRVPLLDGDDHTEGDWAAAFESMGVSQHRYEALAEALPMAELQNRFQRIREIMIRAIAPLPRHGDYLARQCGKIAA